MATSNTQGFWKITLLCSACGMKPPTQHFKEVIDGFSASYGLCGDCLSQRGQQPPLDLFPIDGTQACFYCGKPARNASHNQDVFYAVRQSKTHYTCAACQNIEKEAFQRVLTRLKRDYPKTEHFPVELISDMDREIRHIVRSEPPKAEPL